MGIERYVGRIVVIIYQDKQGQLTKRKIQVHSVRAGYVKAFCMATGRPHTFKTSGILAVEPVTHRVG